jgi:hypothetical protein
MSLNWTEEEYREYLRRRGKEPEQPEATWKKKAARLKYGNKRTERHGRVFDSVHEADCYDELLLRAMGGEIRAVALQVDFHLPGGTIYRADFVTMEKDGTYRVLDAKSEATRKDKVYRLKRRMMRECCGIEIEEI